MYHCAWTVYVCDYDKLGRKDDLKYCSGHQHADLDDHGRLTAPYCAFSSMATIQGPPTLLLAFQLHSFSNVASPVLALPIAPVIICTAGYLHHLKYLFISGWLCQETLRAKCMASAKAVAISFLLKAREVHAIMNTSQIIL